MIVITTIAILILINYHDIKSHGHVSEAKKNAQAHVRYLHDRSSSRFQPLITQKVLRLFPPNLQILIPSYTIPYIPNLE